MIAFIVGAVFGAFVGVSLISLVSINRFEEDADEITQKQCGSNCEEDDTYVGLTD